MKKMITMISAVLCCALLATGCSSKNAASGGGVKMKEGQTVQTVTDQIIDAVGITMGAPLDDMLLKDLYYVDPADVESYAGQMSMANVSADVIVGVQAKDGKIDAVKESLEKRLTDVRKSFEQYLPEQYEKAQKGQVIVKGNYAFLLVLGESTETYDADMKKATELIDAAF